MRAQPQSHHRRREAQPRLPLPPARASREAPVPSPMPLQCRRKFAGCRRLHHACKPSGGGSGSGDGSRARSSEQALPLRPNAMRSFPPDPCQKSGLPPITPAKARLSRGKRGAVDQPARVQRTWASLSLPHHQRARSQPFPPRLAAPVATGVRLEQGLGTGALLLSFDMWNGASSRQLHTICGPTPLSPRPRGALLGMSLIGAALLGGRIGAASTWRDAYHPAALRGASVLRWAACLGAAVDLLRVEASRLRLRGRSASLAKLSAMALASFQHHRTHYYG